jgi:peptidoglycan/xylan/chitin deacetylase (PgdA/CDA1 family)
MSNKPNKMITFSFDDGNIEDIRLVEILNKYKLKCTFNLSASRLSEVYSWDNNGREVKHFNYMEYPNLYEGHEVACHGYSHPRLQLLERKTVYNEIALDRKLLSAVYGKNIKGMAYPYGTYDERVLKILKRCGIQYARTIKNTPDFTPQEDLLQLKANCCFTNPDLDAIIDRFLASESDKKQVLYIWGHTYQLGVDMSWADFEEVCKRLSSVKGLTFETNKDALLKD